MPDRAPAGPERRRTPRFTCAGAAKISCLPSNGVFVPGKIQDLSLGGCCLDTSLPIDSGSKAEVVVRVNSASFRAVGIVKAIRGNSATGIEFVQLSSGGKELLVELVNDLARLRAMLDNLIAARGAITAESFRKQIDAARFHAEMFATRFPFLKTMMTEEIAEQSDVKPPIQQPNAENALVVIPVNLFG
jgi:hypothetical protein